MVELSNLAEKQFKTAILFLIFNRLDTTKEVFAEIKKAKPPRLYIASDGPREAKIDEAEKVNSIREYVLANIDWQCEIKTLFRNKNYGCKIAISEAITWFFKYEEMGIILEDDCLPNQSFFGFCEELLDRYKDNMQVAHIGGNNFQQGLKRGEADYYFSVYSHIWGWATWANRWKNYDVSLNNIENKSFIDKVFQAKEAREYWHHIFSNMKLQKIDSWDYQWLFTLFKNQQLAITPNVNLVKNIGFGPDATHTTKENEQSNLETCEITLKKHPKEIKQNIAADEFTTKNIFNIKPNFK